MSTRKLFRKRGLAAAARALLAGLAGTVTEESSTDVSPRAERLRMAAILKSAADGDDLIDPRLPACTDLLT